MNARLQTVRTNPIIDKNTWAKQRSIAKENPGKFHGDIAKREIHWYDAALHAWVRHGEDGWQGIHAETGALVAVPYAPTHEPWKRAFNDDDAPFYRWFEGGQTNACFNEVDRHVFQGYGKEIAFYFEGDRWDPTFNDGRGGPVQHKALTRKELMLKVVVAAKVLSDLGLETGDRIVINMPNTLEQIYYTEAAKRLGIIYTPVFGGFSDKTLSDRIENAGARAILTSDGGYRNAQIVPFKESYTDPALDRYISVQAATEIVSEHLISATDDENLRAHIRAEVALQAESEITVERSDIMRAVGTALDTYSGAMLDTVRKSKIRTELAKALVDAPPRVEFVLIIKHTRQDIQLHPERDQYSEGLEARALDEILQIARKRGFEVSTEQALLQLDDVLFASLLTEASRPIPVDAEFPLFIMFTSGSTGKPKGVVHVHGGYVSGVAHTMKIAFDSMPGEDVLYVIADPGWITGQSYMISGALTTRTTSVVAEASPLFPDAGRFASIIERYGVTLFKAGSTFLKSVMSSPQNRADVERYDLTRLRVGTFCAEPTSPTVQQFAMDLLTPQYINSYWATEHGGIVFTHFYGNPDFPLRANAHTYPLPWVFGDVWIPNEEDSDGPVAYRVAEPGEKGEIVITQPYPYLARCIWGDVEHFGEPAWRGDKERFVKTYFGKWKGVFAYTQGDFACRYDDESFSLHGRSDDVINVSGHRMGTEEIEGAILRDKQLTPESPVANVIVVGATHREKGLTPVAMIQTQSGMRLTESDKQRLTELVRQEKGAVAVPSDFIEVSQFPETRSGKYMRRYLMRLFEGKPLGDVSTLRNPEALAEIAPKIERWRAKMLRQETQQMFENYRYFKLAYHPTGQGHGDVVAVVTIHNPPVNALNDRALDELNTVVAHLERNQEVKAVIFTGQGSQSFVAGADVKEFLEDMHSIEDVLPLPNKAHLAFSRIERMSKPVIAAINGIALGGGNEFALAAHYRIADAVASFGQPEIRLRLLPGYGGTQRLVRLLHAQSGPSGAVTAVRMIIGGRSITASEAKDVGLVDEVITGTDHVVTRAMQLIREFLEDAHIEQACGAPAKHTASSRLTRVFKQRKEFPTLWNQPQAHIYQEILKDDVLTQMLRQSGHAGRTQAAKRALEAIEYGLLRGMDAGLKREAQLFAEAVIDPEGGKYGIQAFIDKTSAPLPLKPRESVATDQIAVLEASGELLAWDAPFFPGITAMPKWQYAKAVVKDPETGAPAHGDPATAEKTIVIPVEHPEHNEVLVYMLTSEVNFNDIWAITGIPVSQFDNHDLDWHVTGSGGIGLVVELGAEVRREGRIQLGDLVTVYSGQSELLSPLAGRDPMSADFHIQGYETPDGSHQQFTVVQSAQVFPKPRDASLEAAGSYILNLGTIYRALFTTLQIQPGKTLFAEGAATGTGLEAVKTAIANDVKVVGLVSSPSRAEAVRELGAVGVVNRNDPAISKIYTKVPVAAGEWAKWEAEGEPMLAQLRTANQGRLADYVVSHAGEVSFPRSFQLLEEGGVLTFYGASSGYHFTFMGKPGEVSCRDVLQRAELRAGEAALVYYGTDVDVDGMVDPLGLQAIEDLRDMGARIVVATYRTSQKEFVQSLGYGDAVKGVVSIEEIARKYGEDFAWPETMPEFPNPRTHTEQFKEMVRYFNDVIFKPFASSVGAFLKTPDNPRGYPDLVFERSGHDTLGVSSTIVKPFVGRVVYAESMANRRYSFYAPQVWMRQRRIYLPTVGIYGTHLCNAYEVVRMNEMIETGLMSITDPVVVDMTELADAHQAMWENRHVGGTYVANHALPLLGMKTKEDLFEAWAGTIMPSFDRAERDSDLVG